MLPKKPKPVAYSSGLKKPSETSSVPIVTLEPQVGMYLMPSVEHSFNEEPTAEQLADACMWSRHDFGLLNNADKRRAMLGMHAYWRAIWKACNTPGRGSQYTPSPPIGIADRSAKNEKILMPVALTSKMIRAVHEHATTSTEDMEEWYRRLGWLLCAWDVLVDIARTEQSGE